MNRKVTLDQNDIAIRNLPRRLQTRIVENVGNGSLVTANIEGQCAVDGDYKGKEASRGEADKKYLKLLLRGEAQNTASFNDDAATPIGFFINKNKATTVERKSNKSAAPVLETSGQAACVIGGVTASQRGAVVCGDSPKNGESTAIPGILRLNNIEKTRFIETEVSQNSNASGLRENDKNFMTRAQARLEQDVREEQLLPISPARTQQWTSQPAWFKTLTELPYAKQMPQAYETILMMIRRETVLQDWSDFCDARNELKLVFGKLLIYQLKLCCEQKVDTFFWKLLYYSVREYLKDHKSDISQTYLLELINEGTQFYTELYTQLNTKYFQANNAVENAGATHISTQRPVHKFEFIAKVIAQKLLICLGDLSRYKAKEIHSNNYTTAAKYYYQAQSLIPTNGIPYNQLAIVAIQERKKFDAVYFHMRSLMSSNAIYSARESLLVLFDEIRKKYEETELKSSPLHLCSPKKNFIKPPKNVRKEVWIRPDGVRRLHRESENDGSARYQLIISNEGKRCDQIPTDDLMRRFTSLYLYIIGKLYTGIGMETILDHQRKLLVQLSSLFKRNSLPIPRSRLLKTVALNIFILEHNILKDSRREIRYYAFNFAFQMFGVILRKCNDLCKLLSDNTVYSHETYFNELNILLQYVYLFITWLLRNVNIWEPLRDKDQSFIDTCSEWECLYVHLSDLLSQDVSQCIVAKDTQQQSVLLEEEVYLLGFTPLASATNVPAPYSNDELNLTKGISQFQTRITKICSFHEFYLENQEHLKNQEDSSFILEELNNAMEKALCTLESHDENNENIVVNGTNTEISLNGVKFENPTHIADKQVSQLSKRRRELEAQTNCKKLYNAKLEEILKFVDTKLYIEVRPRYLLPDTNCFIDRLDDIERLIKDYKRYTLVIPLTVVKELDGLSKGVKFETREIEMTDRIHHYDDVASCAKKSLDFIRNAKSNIKCATTKGSFLNASLFALAEDGNVSNDDKILATALALAKTMSSETSKDGKCFIQTELVLITTDRNLRVKALTRNLTVSELSEFLQWAKDCN